VDLFKFKWDLYFDDEGYIRPQKICPVLVETGNCPDMVKECPNGFSNGKYSCALSRKHIIEKYWSLDHASKNKEIEEEKA